MSWQEAKEPGDLAMLQDILVEEFYTYVDTARAHNGKATAPRLIGLFQQSVNDSGVLEEGEHLSRETAAELFYEVAERRDGAWNLRPEYLPEPEESTGSNEYEEEDEEMDW